MVRKNSLSADTPSSNHAPSSNRRQPAPARTVARINRRLVIFTGIGLVLCGAGVHGLHAVMVDRNAGGILERADQAERKGDTAEATRLLAQYLQFRPDDLDVLQRYALLLHQPDNPPSTARRVVTALEKVVRDDPSRKELRKPLSEAAMSLGRFTDAEFHLDELLKTQPNDAELVRLKAAARAAQSGPSAPREAAELYIAAIGLDPKNVDAYTELAWLLTENAEAMPYWDPAAKRFLSRGLADAASEETDAAGDGSADEPEANPAVARWASRADDRLLGLFPPVQGTTTAVEAASGLLGRMVSQAQPAWRAYEARARHRQAVGDVAGAAEDIHRALEAPEANNNAELLLLAAGIELAQAQGGDDSSAARHRDAAAEIAESGTNAENGDPRFYGILADAELIDGITPATLVAAEKHLRDGLKQTVAQREAALPNDAARLQEIEVQLRLSLAGLLIQQGENDPRRSERTEQAVARSVDEELRHLREAGSRPELIELIEIRLLVLQRKWDQAAGRLESLRPQVIEHRDLVRQVDLLLGGCYVQLRNPDRRIEVFTRAKTDDPTWVQGRLALAAALAETGRINESLAEYQSLAGDASLPGNTRVPGELARLALRRELQKPPDDRNFAAVEAAVAAAEKESPDDPLTVALRVELLAAQGKFDAADELVMRRAERSPDSIVAWRTAFEVALARGDQPLERRISTARARLEAGEKRFGDNVDIRLARAELARVAEPERLREVITAMIDEGGKLSPEERERLYEGLIAVADRAGDRETAQDVWRSVVATHPDSLAAWLAIAQGAAAAGDATAVDEAMKAVRRIEGPSGPNGDYLEATRLIVRMIRDPKSPDDPARRQEIETARRLLSQASQRRTFWSAVPRALGVLETLAKNPKAAYEQFRRARDLGDTSTDVIRGLVTFHGSENRWDLAGAVIDEAERENPGLFRGGELARLKGVVALKQGELDEAIAALGAAGSADDVEGRLTKASLLFLKYRNLTPDERRSDAGKKILDEATASYRQLVVDLPGEPRAWLACVAHLVSIDRGDEARKIVAEAEQKLPAEPAAERLKTLALCYRTVQDTEKAAERMRQALAAAPDDADLRLDAANFFAVAGDFAEANRQLAWLLDDARTVPPETLARARRLQAIATAATGRYDDLRRAIASLVPVAGGEVPIADLRAQVALLAGRRSLKDRRELIALLEEIRDRSAVSPDATFTDSEKFALAALYQQTNRWALARPLIEELLAEQGVSADYTTALIMGDLRDRSPSLDDAELETSLLPLLDRLKALEPGTMRLALTIAEFDHRFDRDAAAARTLTEYLAALTGGDSRGGSDVTPEELAEIRAIAARAEDLELYDAAETGFRRLAEHSPNPNDGLLAAMYLGRRGRYDEGLTLVENRPDGAAAEATALAAVSIVSAGRPEPQHMARAEKIVNEALMAEPSSTRTLGLLAGLRMAQGRYDEAEAMYRRILAENPSDISVLNNLAWLLVVSGKDAESAEKLITEAIAIAGPLSDLIDTQGVILLALRRPEEAVEVLRDEFENGASPNPAIGFHLATAYLALDRLGDARKTFAKAREMGLGIERLHATEHKAYAELVRRIGDDAGKAGSGKD